MRTALTVLGCITILVWFIGAIHIGMAKQDEWHGSMDKPVVAITDPYTKIVG